MLILYTSACFDICTSLVLFVWPTQTSMQKVIFFFFFWFKFFMTVLYTYKGMHICSPLCVWLLFIDLIIFIQPRLRQHTRMTCVYTWTMAVILFYSILFLTLYWSWSHSLMWFTFFQWKSINSFFRANSAVRVIITLNIYCTFLLTFFPHWKMATFTLATFYVTLFRSF